MRWDPDEVDFGKFWSAIELTNHDEYPEYKLKLQIVKVLGVAEVAPDDADDVPVDIDAPRGGETTEDTVFYRCELYICDTSSLEDIPDWGSTAEFVNKMKWNPEVDRRRVRATNSFSQSQLLFAPKELKLQKDGHLYEQSKKHMNQVCLQKSEE